MQSVANQILELKRDCSDAKYNVNIDDNITRFLMMYCPSKLGVKNSFHAASGRKTVGKNVVIKWKIVNQKAILVNFGHSHISPNKHSNIPNSTINLSASTNGKVAWAKSVTNPVAGESPMTFNKPNQKYTTKRATLLATKTILKFIGLKYLEEKEIKGLFDYN